MTVLLKVSGLSVSYGDTNVVHGIDIDVKEGEVTALLGANGAGKTSTLRAVCGMVRRQGEITLRGKPIQNFPTETIARLGVAHVPDGRGTFSRQSAEENLHLGAAARRDTAEIARDIDLVYTHFPVLHKRRKQQAGTLSGGEQQMLAVGRALMMRPVLMLLDEPSFGLAPLIVKELFGILRALNETRRMSMLLVEQNASLALQLAHSAYLLETGRVVLHGSAAELQRNPIVRHSYLGS